MLSRLLTATRPPTFHRSFLAEIGKRHLNTMPAYLNQKDAQQLDADLMSDEGGFKLEQVRYFSPVLSDSMAN